jgi:hypothetical protein
MWVQFKITYTGPLGMFIEGQKMDLPKEKVAAIRKVIGDKNVVDTCAPWEEHVDKKAVEHNELLTKAKAAITRAKMIATDIERLTDSIKTGQQQLAKLQKEQNTTINNAKKLAKAAGIDWPPKTKSEDAGKSGE